MPEELVEPLPNPYLQYAESVRADVEAALDRYTQFDDGCPPELREAIRHSLLAPCKRLRPLLVLLGAKACGSHEEVALPAACAVEMVHTYSLIHDDLPSMDDDDLRRGQPTCHVRFGEAMAILAGDALLARAFEIMAEEIRPAKVAAQCCGELARAAGATALVGGQVDDLAGVPVGGGVSQLEAIHARKTGAMFRVSLRLGARVAGGNAEQIERLDFYGKNMGLAFQVIDDLLDIEGQEEVLGKRVHKDSSHGKMTFPGILGVDASRSRAHELIDTACDALNGFGEAGSQLTALARFVIERDR